jgi:hypothetical protein
MMVLPFFAPLSRSDDLPVHVMISSAASSSNKPRRYRLWKPSSPTSSVAKCIALFSFCLTLVVVTTTVRYGKSYHQQFLLRRRLRQSSSYSLLSSHPSQQRRLTDRNLRFLALGGPSTGGHGLANALEAYPYQLAKPHNHNVHNYASTEASTPATPSSLNLSKQQQIMTSLCTQSIVGDSNIYDVITLEYQDVDASSLSLLTQRLRERFPRAILILVQLWSPRDLHYYSNGREIAFGEWRILQSEAAAWSDKAAVLRAMQQERWYLREDPEQVAQLEHILRAVGGIIYRMPAPININGNLNVITEWFEEEQRTTEEDSHSSSFQYTLSAAAHSKVSTDLEELVRDELRKSEETTGASISPSYAPVVGTWGSGDSCHLWYETGKGLSHQHYSRGLEHKEFSHHHALEVAAPTGGTLQVHNPFEEDRLVYLTYMTTSANASSKKVYPRTKVHFQGDHSHMILDPSHDDNRDTSHRTRTSAVGVIPAGETLQLEFTPLEEYTLNKFRIVGLSFLAKEKVTYQIPSEFAMLSSHGLVVDDEEEDGTYTSYHHGGPTFSLRWWGNRGDNSMNRQKPSFAIDSSSTSDDKSQQ